MRLISCGFETGSATTGKEYTTGGSSPSIVSIPHGGTYSLLIGNLGSGQRRSAQWTFNSSEAANAFYFRVYLRVGAFPSAENRVVRVLDTTGAVSLAYITLDETGVLRLYDEDGQIGSASWVLSTSRYYCIEMRFDRTGGAGSHIVNARIDGSQFATASNRSISAEAVTFSVGGNLNLEGNTAGQFFFDDIAVNDSTGASQTSFAGGGKLIHLRPDDAGDANNWRKSDGSGGDSTNYTSVDEVNPDDGTTYLRSLTISEEDLYNVSSSGLSGSDTINLVAIGVRAAGAGVASNSTFIVEVEKSSGGTKALGSAITPADSTWLSNGAASGVPGPSAHTLIGYTDPDSVAWTSSTLDTMQIGMKITANGANRTFVSTIWALVDYTESGGNTTTSSSTTSSTSTSTSSSTTSSSTTSIPGATTSSSTSTSSSSSSSTSTSSSTTSSTTSTSTSSSTTSSSSSTTTAFGHTSSSTTSTSSSSTTTPPPSALTPELEIAPIVPILEVRRTYRVFD